ncbi:MAG: AEC family transporter [Clostridia bacterium]|nr:AEC family transporter [Clostridia bacterium]
MIIILEQLFLLFSFMLVGYILGKLKIVDTAHTKILSAFAVNIFVPCTVFKSFSSNFTAEYLAAYYPFVIASAVVVIILVIIAHFASKLFSRSDYERAIYRYSLIVPNYGYMGYALAEGLYGAAGLLNFIVFSLPVSVYTYTVGYSMLTKRELSLKKLLNPIMVALALGAVFGLTGIKVPDIVTELLSKGSGCMAPISMLLAGLTISEFDIKSLINEKKTYIAALLRLAVIPFAVMLVLKPLGMPELTRTAVLFYSMPCGLNTIVFPRLIDENCMIGAKLAFVSNLCAIATIPLILNLI